MHRVGHQAMAMPRYTQATTKTLWCPAETRNELLPPQKDRHAPFRQVSAPNHLSPIRNGFPNPSASLRKSKGARVPGDASSSWSYDVAQKKRIVRTFVVSSGATRFAGSKWIPWK